MKQLIITITSLLWAVSLFAQDAGTITYTQTIKIEINAPEGMDLGDMMPSEMSSKKDLYFANNVSVYKDAPDQVTEDHEISSDDGSFQLVIKTDDGEEILYTDVKEKMSINQTTFMGKEFLIEEQLEKHKWKITGDRIKYLDYVCQKATMTEVVPALPGEEEDGPVERQIVAWFTSEIPVSIGPGSYNQLPGAILMVSVDEGKTEIKATEVNLESPDIALLSKPKKGQKVTTEEYEKIMAEKMKVMEKMYGGREGAIMIRG